MSILRLSEDEIASRLRSGNVRIGVIGLGRIGVPTAVLFAEAGAKVVGGDINPAVVKGMNQGFCHFIDEPGLAEAVAKVVLRGRLSATIDNREAAIGADVVIMCLPTPVDESKTPNYSFIVSASKDVSKSLGNGCIVAVESTVGPGIIENLIIPMLEEGSGLKAGEDFGVVACPDRSDPGRVLRDMKKVPRIVGGTDSRSTSAFAALYGAASGVR
ncbi:MAG TPA: 3-hydroxyacyl-CoA dehydrogenase NAD-binding domain-containing protein, partial [Nitrososphaerales archaeon]